MQDLGPFLLWHSLQLDVTFLALSLAHDFQHQYKKARGSSVVFFFLLKLSSIIEVLMGIRDRDMSSRFDLWGISSHQVVAGGQERCSGYLAQP